MPPPHPSAIGYRPCMVLATGAFAHPPEVWLRLRRLGWDIYPAKVGPEVRRLSRMLEPDLVVLDTDLEGESGWLTCAKLIQERPTGEVVLLAGDDGPRNRTLAAFVGASALIPRQHNLVTLLHPRRLRAGVALMAEAA
jgi:DNA-binding response OmpR family regulator